MDVRSIWSEQLCSRKIKIKLIDDCNLDLEICERLQHANLVCTFGQQFLVGSATSKKLVNERLIWSYSPIWGTPLNVGNSHERSGWGDGFSWQEIGCDMKQVRAIQTLLPLQYGCTSNSIKHLQFYWACSGWVQKQPKRLDVNQMGNSKLHHLCRGWEGTPV